MRAGVASCYGTNHDLTAEQPAEFAERGLLRLPGFCPSNAIAAMFDRLREDSAPLHGTMPVTGDKLRLMLTEWIVRAPPR